MRAVISKLRGERENEFTSSSSCGGGFARRSWACQRSERHRTAHTHTIKSEKEQIARVCECAWVKGKRYAKANTCKEAAKQATQHCVQSQERTFCWNHFMVSSRELRWGAPTRACLRLRRLSSRQHREREKGGGETDGEREVFVMVLMIKAKRCIASRLNSCTASWLLCTLDQQQHMGKECKRVEKTYATRKPLRPMTT